MASLASLIRLRNKSMGFFGTYSISIKLMVAFKCNVSSQNQINIKQGWTSMYLN